MEDTESAALPPAVIDPFEGVAETFNEADIRATQRFLGHEGHGVTEVRVISPGRGVTGIGYFDDEDAFVAACAKASGTGNVYVGIQPRPARLLAQAPNRLARLRAGAHESPAVRCRGSTRGRARPATSGAPATGAWEVPPVCTR